MDLQIDGLRVLVTAGAGGIGLEIARAFAARRREGACLRRRRGGARALAKSDPEVTRSTSRRVGPRRRSRGSSTTRSRRSAGSTASSTTPASPGRPAGSRRSTRRTGTAASRSTSPASSTARGSRCRTCKQEPQRVSIANLSSAAGRFGFPLRTPYSAAKWGVVGFTKSLAIELGEFGIRVNAILPGIVEGDRIRRVFEAKAKERGVSPEEQLGASALAAGLDQGPRDRRSSSPT